MNAAAAAGGSNVPIQCWAGDNIHSDAFELKLHRYVRAMGAEGGGDGADDVQAAEESRAKRHKKEPAQGCGHERRVVLVGIHLCRRLSSRFVELANSLGPG